MRSDRGIGEDEAIKLALTRAATEDGDINRALTRAATEDGEIKLALNHAAAVIMNWLAINTDAGVCLGPEEGNRKAD